jgi:hypothetical protein
MRKLTGSVCLLLLAAAPAMAVQGQEVRSVRNIQPELKVIEENCLNCHNRQRIDSARKERKDAESILQKMEAKGVKLSPNDRQVMGFFFSSPYKSDHPEKTTK